MRKMILRLYQFWLSYFYDGDMVFEDLEYFNSKAIHMTAYFGLMSVLMPMFILENMLCYLFEFNLPWQLAFANLIFIIFGTLMYSQFWLKRKFVEYNTDFKHKLRPLRVNAIHELIVILGIFFSSGLYAFLAIFPVNQKFFIFEFLNYLRSFF